MHYTTLFLSILGATAVAAAPAAAPAAQSPANELLARAAMRDCNQGNCPDYDQQFDLEAELRNGQWYYWLRDRANGGDSCRSYPTDAGGCGNFDTGRRVCIDWQNYRGHSVYGGVKQCFTVKYGYVCGNTKWIAAYYEKEECYW